MSARIRIATINIWGTHGDWPKRRRVLKDTFDVLQPDLVTLQETVVTPEYDQVRDLFGSGHHVLHQERRSPEGLGCSIVSRREPVRTSELDLRDVTDRVDPNDFLGVTSVAEFDTAVGPVVLVNHKPNWQVALEHERELQALLAAEAIEEFVDGRSVHVVVAGDFDARPESASVRFWTGRQSLGGLSVGYQDAWEIARPDEPGYTFTAENPLVGVEADWLRIPPRRIDYILIRCDERGPTLRVDSCDRLFDQPVGGTWATDHYGVMADLVLP